VVLEFGFCGGKAMVSVREAKVGDLSTILGLLTQKAAFDGARGAKGYSATSSGDSFRGIAARTCALG
jgi:hypothetical protein